MLKANEVMTRALAVVAPEESVSHVAAIMRDRNIGNVLVMESGKLCGIVTDRDLTLQALTGQDDPRQTPISKYMSTQVLTGEADWKLEKVAETMARHQVRRLPIVQNGELVGIISLGDVALREDRENVITESLQAISVSNSKSTSGFLGLSSALIGFTLAALAATMTVWLTWSHSGQSMRKQIAKNELYHSAQHVVGAAQGKVNEARSILSVNDLRRQVAKSELYHTAQHAVNSARDKVNEAASSRTARDLRHQMHSNLNVLAAQLPTIEYKAPKRKLAWFG
jgi:CBS domain-containing protein